MLVREFDQPRRQREGTVNAGVQGVGRAFVADVVFKFRPRVLQDGANLHFKGEIRVVFEVLHALRNREGEVVRPVAEAAGDFCLLRLVHGFLQDKRVLQHGQYRGNLGGVIGGHTHAHHVVNICPRVRVDEVAVTVTFCGFGVEGAQVFHPHGHAIKGHTRVHQQIFDGGVKILRCVRVRGRPLGVDAFKCCCHNA